MRTSNTMRKSTTAGSLYRLIYRSREVIAHAVPDAATETGLQRELRAIVAAGRWRNKADNVTGALLFNDAGFSQVLEGPRDVLERTFERIAADPRHTDVTVLSFTPTPQRSFPDWPMGFCALQPVAAADPASIPPDTLAPARVSTGIELLRLLERVVRQEDAWSEA